jgi:23S rRNA (adenine2503-C2)-methyltransferase
VTVPLPVSLPDACAGSTRANLLGLNRDRLDSLFEGLGERRFRSSQVLKWIHQFRCDDFGAMSNLSKALRSSLAEVAEVRAPQPVGEQVSHDGTRKWLLQVDGGNCIETVFIPETRRGTLCVSSQVGCALNCSFCSTAQQGFNRNLGSAEIVGQLWHASRMLERDYPGERPISNVVLMGMGEPLLNFDAVTEALDIMLEDFAYGLSKRRVTLSTAGHVPGIDRLAARRPVALAVSLHAPEDRLRDELVPLNRTFPIRELMQACQRYVAHDPRQRITFEYVMLDGVNDSDEHALTLCRLLRHVPSKVNLIPFNPFPGTRYRRSPAARIARFLDILSQHGLTTITRKTRGDDIDAACGQLAGRVEARSARVRRRQARRAGVGEPSAPTQAS